jgi:hypothetical protein
VLLTKSWQLRMCQSKSRPAGRVGHFPTLESHMMPGSRPGYSTPPAVLLRNATPSVFHQRDIGRMLRSSCNTRGRRIASSRDHEL